MKSPLAIKLSLLLLSTIITVIKSPAQKATLPLLKHSFTVIAHRGDHVAVPENTLASIEQAIEHEVDFVEMDLRTTKDSALVIMHDATVDRMTNGKGNVSGFTLAEIKGLKVKKKDTDDKDKSYTVPTFEEVLKTCKNKINIYLDFKNASVKQTYQLIQQYGMEKQVIVYINAAQQFIDWRSIAPSMPLMISLPDTITTGEALSHFLQLHPADLLDGDYTDYNEQTLSAANRLKIPVWPDIQSEHEDKNWDEALKKGFTGLQTDHPAALIAYLKLKGLR